MRRGTVLGLLVLLLGPVPAGLARPEDPSPEIERSELKDWIRRLADDDLEGREAGTAVCDQVADLIAAEYERLGLQPAGDDGTWFQAFSRPKGLRVLPTSTLVATDDGGRSTTFEVGEDFAPLDISAPGDVTGEAVFAGYGISAPDLGYDDYADLDVRDRVAVVLRHAPAYRDRDSPFANAGAMARYAAFQAKAERAARAGARAIVFVNDPETFARGSDDTLRPPGGSAAGTLPAVHVTWRTGRRLARRLGLPLHRRQQQIDAKMQPFSEALPGTRLHVRCDVEPDLRRMKNVLGLLVPGDAPTTTGEASPEATTETVVIGAHYDHVGLGHFGSLANADGEIHNGADDNASGTSALLEIAGWLASRREDLRRRVLFIAFSGEELGLLGSKHYVGAPTVPLSDIVAMLNFDMVGRLEKNRLFVGGTGTSPVWPGLLERLNDEEGRFDLTTWPGGKAPSDHTSFYERDIPVLFFFTGLHEDYHRPSDDWNRIEYRGHERVVRFGALVALELATGGDRPAFTRCDAGGFEVGPYLGVAVDPREDGLFVVHVDDRSPADRAGFRVGDKIVRWEDRPVPNANVWNDVLSKAEPGDRVVVTVERDGRERRLRVRLGRT